MKSDLEILVNVVEIKSVHTAFGVGGGYSCSENFNFLVRRSEEEEQKEEGEQGVVATLQPPDVSARMKHCCLCSGPLWSASLGRGSAAWTGPHDLSGSCKQQSLELKAATAAPNSLT